MRRENSVEHAYYDVLTMDNLHLISAIMVSALRKKTYLYLLIALTSPLLLSTVLLSMPSLSMFLEVMSQRVSPGTMSLLVRSSASSGDCIPVELLGTITLNDTELPVLVVPVDVFLENLFEFKEVSYTSDFTSLPQEVYEELQVESVLLNGCTRRVSHVHRGINAVIVLGEVSTESDTKLCRVSTSHVLKEALFFVESSLIEVSKRWLLLVLLAHTPLVYVAVLKARRALEEEFNALHNLGVSRGKILLGFSLVVLFVCVIVSVFIVSMSVVIVNSVHKFTSLYWFTPQPYTRSALFYYVAGSVILVFASSLVAGFKKHV
jgi:hypothetical protein